MKLIDKDTLVAKIESLKRVTFTNFDEGVNMAAQTLLETINTLEVKEECASDDLEEAAKSYPSIICTISPQWKNEIENVFKAGAEWQKEQMIQKVFERLEYHIAYYYGKRITDPAEFIKQFKCIMEE